jgi:hypothetical protein
MERFERVTVLAQRAAALLPEPPHEDDAFGFLAWEELVLTTARRIGDLAGDDLLKMSRACGTAPGSGITWQALVKLAVLQDAEKFGIAAPTASPRLCHTANVLGVRRLGGVGRVG